MNGNEAVLKETPAATVSNAASLDDLKEMHSRAVALLGETAKETVQLGKRIARIERGAVAGSYQAPVVAYKGEEVLDRITEVQAKNEELLARGGTVILKITGGDVRPLSLMANQIRHYSGQGIRRITQASPKGANQAPRCLNIVDLPDGSFQMTAGNELNLPGTEGKTWE